MISEAEDMIRIIHPPHVEVHVHIYLRNLSSKSIFRDAQAERVRKSLENHDLSLNKAQNVYYES
jgi:hypothetical protein